MSKHIETTLEHLLTNSHKAKLISYLESNPGDFVSVIKLAIADHQPYSWRAAWLLWSCMKKNDKRLRKYLEEIIDILPARKDSHQRELLLILQRMEPSEEHEGKLFDICAKIWEQTAKIASVRYNAFKLMVSISKNHKELFGEIKTMTESFYTDNLSETVKKSISKLIKEIEELN
jgi:hypothetical protein